MGVDPGPPSLLLPSSTCGCQVTIIRLVGSGWVQGMGVPGHWPQLQAFLATWKSQGRGHAGLKKAAPRDGMWLTPGPRMLLPTCFQVGRTLGNTLSLCSLDYEDEGEDDTWVKTAVSTPHRDPRGLTGVGPAHPARTRDHGSLSDWDSLGRSVLSVRWAAGPGADGEQLRPTAGRVWVA